jgi:hypothetical protein
VADMNTAIGGISSDTKCKSTECAIGHGIGWYRPYSISVGKLLWIRRRLRQEGIMPLLRSLPEQPVMRDLYRSQPVSCKPLGELTEVAMRGPSPFTQGQRELIAAYVSGT